MKAEEGSFSVRLRKVQERIQQAARRGGRKPEDVRLIGASKTVSADRLKQAHLSGLSRFGENRVQEALPKLESLGSGIEWHFIGHLQRNKVKSVVGRFVLIHSLDSLALAKEINRCCEAQGRAQRVLLEVNVSGEAGKEGLALSEVEGLVRGLQDFPFVQLEGLMTIPPYASEPEASRTYFRSLKTLRDRLVQSAGKPLPELSMGMSNDFEVGIEEGATFVRVGTALFGERPPLH